MTDETHNLGDDRGADDDAVIGRAFRVSLLVVALVGAMATGIILWRNWVPDVPPAAPHQIRIAEKRATETEQLPHVPFTDVTDSAGISFRHENGAYGMKFLPETMGGGCAFFDYDSDGDQDLLLVNSTGWDQTEWNIPESANAGAGQDVTSNRGAQATMALFANDGTGQYADVTAAAGLDASLYGMGVAVGDYDNDGDRDLFLSAVGENYLFRNDGQLAGFTDVTDDAGVAGAPDAWSTSSAWLDYDNDGDLDLFVCNYVHWSPEIDLIQNYTLDGVGRAYGPPTGFEGTFAFLYRNEGDGTFTDVSEPAGIQIVNEATGAPAAKALGVAPVDLDADGWIDLVVSNDTVRNFVFHNRQDGTFVEIGMATGVAFDSTGKARGAMGIDTAALGRDGNLAIAIGNFANEMTAFFMSHGDPLFFSDDAVATGIGPQTRLALSFGLFFFDADLNGWPDLLAANGHIEEEINRVQQSQAYRQPAKLFFNLGGSGPGRFVPATADQLGEAFFTPIVGRGAAYADIDADGDLDVALTQIAGPPLLLRNDQRLDRHWVRIKLVGRQCNRDAIGATVEVHTGGRVHRQHVMPTRSYLSQVELPVTIGLGSESAPREVVIQWPGGGRQTIDAKVDALTVVEEQSEEEPSLSE